MGLKVYPIRLFFFEGYAFAFLQLIYKYGIGNLLFGNLTFLLANGINPRLIGYRDWHIVTLPKRLKRGLVRLDRDELEHSLYLIKRNLPNFPLDGKPHWHVEMVHFNDKSSRPDNIPPEFREKLYSIFEEYTRG